MRLFKLERHEYKKLSKEFRNTYVGRTLYTIFVDSRIVAIFVGILPILEGVLMAVAGKESTDISNFIYAANYISIWICLLIAVLSYYVYFKYLTKYIESKEEK